MKFMDIHKPKRPVKERETAPVRSPVMRTREGLIMERAGPTKALKSRALSGWCALKWRSESCTTHIRDSGPPFASMTLLLKWVFESRSILAWICSENAAKCMVRQKSIRITTPISSSWWVQLLCQKCSLRRGECGRFSPFQSPGSCSVFGQVEN